MLSGVYEKSRGMDYSSLKPIKHDSRQSALSKKANEFDIENNPRLQTYDNHKLKGSGFSSGEPKAGFHESLKHALAF